MQQGNFGSDFTIKKQGVIDNFLTTTSNAFVSLEDIGAYLEQMANYRLGDLLKWSNDGRRLGRKET